MKMWVLFEFKIVVNSIVLLCVSAPQLLRRTGPIVVIVNYLAVHNVSKARRMEVSLPLKAAALETINSRYAENEWLQMETLAQAYTAAYFQCTHQ